MSIFHADDDFTATSQTSGEKPASAKSGVIQRFRPTFKAAVKKHDFDLANRTAMSAAEELFTAERRDARQVVWENFYSRIAGKAVVQYQCYDFESVDYELFPMDGIPRLLRGPKIDIAASGGRYVSFLGAAQFFGRHRRTALHTLVAEAAGIPCLNLGVSGAGPEFFLSDNVLQIVNSGAAAVLQVMSGRSAGCDEYPGGDVTFRKDTGKKVKRLVLLTEIWNESREEAIRLVRKWQDTYVQTMLQLLSGIHVPVVLVWLSPRTPGEWRIDKLVQEDYVGKFPHLVDEAMLGKLSAKSTEVVRVTRDEGLPEEIFSRFNGKKCPIFERDGSRRWTNRYYPSAAAVEQASGKIASALRAIGVV